MKLRYLIAALGVYALGACTDEEIVYRDKPTFNPPPDSVNGFLGYFTASTKQTTCGNCHVGTQGDWVNTKHAQAWSDLQLSGHTHGGQFWPWTYFVRFQQPFTAGLDRLGSLWVYTSRGTGYWGPPKRFGAPSEITRIRLVAAQSPSTA